MRMIKTFLVFFLAITLVNCKNDDDITFFYELVPIKEVQIPKEFERGKKYTITVYYQRPTDCYSFAGFDTNSTGNEQKISVINIVINKDSCKNITSTDLAKATFEFFSGDEKVYIFKFWQGQKENGDDQLLIIEVPVV